MRMPNFVKIISNFIKNDKNGNLKFNQDTQELTKTNHPLVFRLDVSRAVYVE